MYHTVTVTARLEDTALPFLNELEQKKRRLQTAVSSQCQLYSVAY